MCKFNNFYFQVSQLVYLTANTICLAQEVYKINDLGILKPIKAFKQVFFEGVVFPYTLVSKFTRSYILRLPL